MVRHWELQGPISNKYIVWYRIGAWNHVLVLVLVLVLEEP